MLKIAHSATEVTIHTLLSLAWSRFIYSATQLKLFALIVQMKLENAVKELKP